MDGTRREDASCNVWVERQKQGKAGKKKRRTCMVRVEALYGKKRANQPHEPIQQGVAGWSCTWVGRPETGS
jgi:hypothetical protein